MKKMGRLNECNELTKSLFTVKLIISTKKPTRLGVGLRDKSIKKSAAIQTIGAIQI